jgi:hypothetical protein
MVVIMLVRNDEAKGPEVSECPHANRRFVPITY